MAVRVLLADDHEIVRQGLRILLEREGFQVVGEAPDGHEAVKLCEASHPEVAILDVSMPLLNGVDAAREIMKANPHTKVVLLTMHTEDHLILESLRAGVTGYVLKARQQASWCRALRAVRPGEMFLTRAFRAQLSRPF